MRRRGTNLLKGFNPTVWWIVLLIFPLISPTAEDLQALFGQSVGSRIMTVFRLWNIASIVIALFMTFTRKRLSNHVYWATLFCVVLGVSTFLQKNPSFMYTIRLLGSTLILFLLSNIYNKHKFKYYLQAIYYTLTIIGILASLTIYIYYPTGMGSANHYLYGLDNLSFIYAFHGFAIGFIYNIAVYEKLKPSFLLSYIFIGGAYVYAETGTGRVIIAICIVLIFIYKMNFFEKLNYRNTLLTCLAVFLFFVVIQNFSAVTKIFDLIGKDATLNGRTTIWRYGWKVIKQHFLIGIGVTDSLVYYYLEKAGFPWSFEIGHMHNIVLEILYKGGITTLTCFVMMWISNYKAMMKNKKYVVTSMINVMILLSWLICIFEFRVTTYSFWFLLIVTYHINDIVKFSNKSNHKELR